MEERKPLNPEIAACKDAYLAGKKVPDIDIAQAAFTVLDEYRWIPEPTPPEKVKKFMTSSADLKKKMREKPEDYKTYWDDHEVKEYYDRRCTVRHLNERNKAWLEWMKKTLPEEHEVAIKMKLHQFSDQYHQDIDQPKWSD